MLRFIKRLFCNHKKQILCEQVYTNCGKRYKEIFCNNCKKVLIRSWLYEKIEKALRE
jgi:hypothetical protein